MGGGGWQFITFNSRIDDWKDQPDIAGLLWTYIFEFEGRFRALSHPMRPPGRVHIQSNNLFSPVMMITWWMKLGGNLPPIVCPVTQTRLDIPRPLITQSHRHGSTYQGLWLPVLDHSGESASARGRFETPTCLTIVEHAKHQTTMTAPNRKIKTYTPGPQRGIFSTMGGSSAITAPQRVGSS